MAEGSLLVAVGGVACAMMAPTLAIVAARRRRSGHGDSVSSVEGEQPQLEAGSEALVVADPDWLECSVRSDAPVAEALRRSGLAMRVEDAS